MAFSNDFPKDKRKLKRAKRTSTKLSARFASGKTNVKRKRKKKDYDD